MEPSDSASGEPDGETGPEGRPAEGPTVVESRTDDPKESDGLTVTEWLAEAGGADVGEPTITRRDSSGSKPQPPAYPAEEPIDLTTESDAPTSETNPDPGTETTTDADGERSDQPRDKADKPEAAADQPRDKADELDAAVDEPGDKADEPTDTAAAEQDDGTPSTDASAAKDAEGPTDEAPKTDAETKTDDAETKTDDAGTKTDDAGTKTDDAETEPDETDDAETEPDETDDAETKTDDADQATTKTKQAEDTTAVLSEIKALPAPDAGERIVRPADTGEVPVVRPPRKGLRRLVMAGGVVVGLYLLLAAGWAVDTALHRDQAMRGVQLDDVGVGGQDGDQLAATIEDLTDRLASSSIDVDLDGTTVTTDPVSLGLRLDEEAMIDDALAARRGGFLPVRPIRWAADLFSSETVEPSYLVDDDAAEDATEELLVAALEPAVEPTIEMDDDRIVTVAGVEGQTVSAADLAADLPAAVEAGEPFRLDLPVQVATPELDQEAVESVVDEINESTAEAILIKVLDDATEVPPELQRSWIELDTSADPIGWVIDEEQALDDLQPLFPTLGSEDQQARFQVVDEEPIIIPASETVICCAQGSGEILAETIASPIPIPEPNDEDEDEDDASEDEAQSLRNAVLEPEVTGSDEGVAELEALGIIELVSTFTTNHACCENRVRNIQRFADLTQGVIIRPGETFSLNGHVGRRTRENGFFAAGAIALGNFEDQVGGGISQYATTFFNAAFFAGLEFVEYQSHSIYISRYPRGREATISWPRPDLEVRNTTEYGILVWNEYTPNSITVSFYSTEHLEVEALPLLRSSDRQCRIDITPRVITFPDGSTVEDRVRGIYRPGEGLDCNGNSTRPEEEEPEAPTTPEPPDPEPPDPELPDPDDEVLPPDG